MTIYRKQTDGTYTVQSVGAPATPSRSAAAAVPARQRADAAPVDRHTPVYLTRVRYAGPARDDDPLALIPVYRAIQVLTTAALQLPLVVERGGRKLTGPELPALIRKPSLEMDRSEFISQCVMSLALTGELFLQRIRMGAEIVEVRILDPNTVTVTRDERTRVKTFHIDGKKYTEDDVDHQALMRRPGALRGFGPIQAARTEVTAQADVRDYAGNWFRDSGHPSGILKTDQPLSPDEALRFRDQWNHYDRDKETFTDQDGSNPSRIRTLGKGLDYTPLFLNPKDAQWLEVRKFNVTDMARLFGVPSSLMLVSLDGNSLTYSNVEQEWLAFIRFTAMAYLRKIEEALSHLTPLGQVVRFNIDALLRSDTNTRYQSYESGIRSGWMDPDEARAHEDLPPLTEAQRARIAAANSTAQTPQEVTP